MDFFSKMRRINIQNLERKTQVNTKNLSKEKRLAKYHNTKNADVFFFEETDDGDDKIHISNNFIGAFMCAYNNHGDIVLNPDTIWIAIMLYLSTYIDNNAEALRSKFVHHEGKMELRVNELVGSVEESLEVEKKWDVFFEQIRGQIIENTHDGVVNKLECDFSTTNRITQIASTSILMNGFKKYFSYERSIMMCGINNVYFEGVREDWVKLIEKAKLLEEYDVNGVLLNYLEHINVILRKFLETFDGNSNISFWNNIMTTENVRIGSGGDTEMYIHGWITHFYGIYEVVPLYRIPEYSVSVPIKLINHCTKTTRDLDLRVRWSSVSKYDEYTYKPNLEVFISYESQDTNDNNNFYAYSDNEIPGMDMRCLGESKKQSNCDIV